MTVIQNSRIPAIFSPSSALWINLIRCFAMQEHARFQTRAPSMLAGFEIQDKRHQKSNAGVSVAPQKGLISSELKKNYAFGPSVFTPVHLSICPYLCYLSIRMYVCVFLSARPSVCICLYPSVWCDVV